MRYLASGFLVCRVSQIIDRKPGLIMQLEASILPHCRVDFFDTEAAIKDLTRASRLGSAAGVEQLIAEVTRALDSTGYQALRHLVVEVVDNTVLLWGIVSTCHQKQIAQRTAQSIPGVRSVANGIEVNCC